MEKRKGYAYIDKGGIMHIVENFNTALDYVGDSNKMVETEIEYAHGYPVVNGEQVIVYGPEDMKLDANEGNIEPIPVLAALYKECMGK